MSSARVFGVCGLLSFRAHFNWLNPWILLPTLMVEPVASILLFAYVGRAAGVGDDRFYVIGNALLSASIPCVFAMIFAISGERNSQTLGLVLSTPVRRLPLFLGRSLPVIATGSGVAVFGLVLGALILDVAIPTSAWSLLAVSVVVATISCAGVGLLMGAACLRLRDSATVANLGFLVLLVFSGANVAVDDLPAWMAAISQWLPLTHGIEAARDVAAGADVGAVAGLLARELATGLAYAVAGLGALAWMERSSRRWATLERM